MKKHFFIIVFFVISLFTFSSFSEPTWKESIVVAAEKTVTMTFTEAEVVLIYDALGELPAKQVEQLRQRIAFEANKQLSDTTKKPK